ncbi:hypothetical protein F4775DRAFT_602171 [Biscogniauxia sp. FL1348]|nr:hypothetical protein F4775DRAFT_602171 [Biscogniauxia sp. FL1348]
MPPIDTESQFRFLISCIRNSSAGKVNFTEVANECDIVSKGAAAKRYERLMRAHGIQSGGAPGGAKKEPGDSKDTKELKDAKESRKGRGGTAATKKRKLAKVEDDAGDIDEPVKTEIKGEVKSEVKLEDAVTVKPERSNDDPMTPAVPGFVPPRVNHQMNGDGDDDDDDEVLVVSATEKRDTQPTTYNNNSNSNCGDNHHHHHHPHPHPLHHSYSLAAVPGMHSFDYAATNIFPHQHQHEHQLEHEQQHSRMQSLPTSTLATPTTTTKKTTTTTPPTATTMMSTSAAYPYGFGPGTWMYSPHDAHGYLQ